MHCYRVQKKISIKQSLKKSPSCLKCITGHPMLLDTHQQGGGRDIITQETHDMHKYILFLTQASKT